MTLLAAKFSYRSTLRKLPKKFSDTRSKKGPGKRISITSGKESELSEEAVAEEETDRITTTTDAIRETRDPHLPGAGSHHTEMTTVGLPGAILRILIFLVTETGGGIKFAGAHLHLLGHLADLYHDQ